MGARKILAGVVAVLCGSIGLVGAAAPVNAADTVLWDQYGALGGSVPSTTSEDNSSLSSEPASDFTVPTGAVWTITAVEAWMTNVIDEEQVLTVDVRFRADDAGSPGAVVAQRSATGTLPPPVEGSPYGLREVTLALSTDVELAAGTYWVSLQVVEGGSALTSWGALAERTAFGVRDHLRRPAGQPCSEWCPLIHEVSYRLVGTSTVASPECEGHAATVTATAGVPTVGTSGDDVIVGTDGADVISGAGGHDLICALGGDDVVSGGNGADSIHGGDGADWLKGNKGDDLLVGGAGDDRLNGQQHDDALLGGEGDDTLNGDAGTDGCDGEGGSDKLVACEGPVIR